MADVNSFEDLNCWKMGRELRNEVKDIQFCRTSLGSLYELLDQFITSLDEGYINEEEYQKYKKRVNDCLAVLNGYINYLKKASINDNK